MKSCCGFSGLLSYHIYYCCNRSYPVCHSILCQILLDFLFLFWGANLVSLICWADIYWETMTYRSPGENNWLYPHRDSSEQLFLSLSPFTSATNQSVFHPRCLSCSLFFLPVCPFFLPFLFQMYILLHKSSLLSSFMLFLSFLKFHCQLCQCIWLSSSIDGFTIKSVKFRGQINSCQGYLIPRERRIIIRWGTWN